MLSHYCAVPPNPVILPLPPPQYPKEILEFKYDPRRSIRGLHYDIQKGLVLKMDSINQIQLGTVYRGHRKLSDEEVLKHYNRIRIPQDYVEAHLKGGVR